MKYIIPAALFFILACKTKTPMIPLDTKVYDSVGLPYYNIPEYPTKLTAENTVARMIDGLGFRYYWATDQLKSEDLAFKPNESARTTEETIDHIYGLSVIIYNSLNGINNEKSGDEISSLPFEIKRKKTLINLMASSELLKADKRKLKDMKIVFPSKSYPFWNVINGPIADALWHVGQIVSFRRSSGNPFNNKVSVLNGTVKE